MDYHLKNTIKSFSLLNGLQSAVSGALSSDLPDIVKVMHSDHEFNIDLLEPELRESVKFQDMIYQDAKNGGNLFETLLNGVEREHSIEAGRPGTHAEILAVNELIKELKNARKFNSLEDLQKVKVITKGQTDNEEMQLHFCMNCFYILREIQQN
jgi:hypothetical protein